MAMQTEQSLDMGIAESRFDQLVAHVTATVRSSKLGMLAVADQMIVSGTRFLTAIIVGRACGPGELGDYMLGFTVFCLAIAVQGALISGPLTFFGNQCRGQERRTFFGSTLAHLAVFSSLVAVTLGLISGVLALGYGPSKLAPLVAMLACTFPLAFMAEFARRFALARLEINRVLIIDAVKSAVQIALLIALLMLGLLSATGAFLAMGIGSAVVGFTWFGVERHQFVVERARVWADTVRSWRRGRWFLVSQITLALRASSLLWVLVLMLNASSTGIFSACETLLRLVSPLSIAVAAILFPKAAAAYAVGDILQVRRLVKKSAIVLGLAAAVLFVLCLLIGDVTLAHVYGAMYAGNGAALSLLALAGIADALDTAASNGLAGIDRPNLVVLGDVMGTAGVLVLAAVLVGSHGIAGAALGCLIGRSVGACVTVTAFLSLTGGRRLAEAQT